MVSMPPRHGKSEITSRYAPAWYLSLFPDRQVMLASYEADFAASWGRKARDVLEEWGPTFGLQVRQDSSAANRWQIAGREGGMVTAGVGGPITGRGAHLLIVDDPVKNAEDAMSRLKRDKAWEWWQSTAMTRLEPGGAAIIVQTRWHTDDLSGRLLQHEPGRWRVINLPALAEPDDPLGRSEGEPLWPDRYDRAALDEIRQSAGSFWWSALYQQRPVPREGGMFRRHWFDTVDVAPAAGKRVRYWDLAATEAGRGDPDWTVGARLSHVGGEFYVEDVVRLRGSPAEVERTIVQTARADGPGVRQIIEQEPGASGKSMVAYYVRQLAGFPVAGWRPSGPKEVRADPFASQAEAGNVKLVAADWNSPFLDELELFPLGDHDDQVDAAASAFANLLEPRSRKTSPVVYSNRGKLGRR
jgi:predicted phage terminase large subunit-like protein